MDINALQEQFGIRVTPAVEAYVPAYNVTPGDGLVAVTNDEPDSADVFEWGFIPVWADDPDDVPTPINARAETVSESNLFRTAFEHQRCLILADGFYEWQGRRGSKQPYRICRVDRAPFAFAGLWSHWESEETDAVRETTTILTTDANDVVEPIHDRMPVILEPEEHHDWLQGDTDDAKAVLDPYPASDLDAYPVSKNVNNPTNDGPDLLEEIDPGTQSGLDDYE